MNTDDTALENLPDPFAPAQPCCGETLALGDLPEQLPEPAQLQEELDLLQSQMGTEADELLFADLEAADLTFEQELELAGLTKQPLPPLEDILSIAERYPGLKVTFSF